jgi:ATP-dependent DNA helicase RecQ
VLKGDVPIVLREVTETPRAGRGRTRTGSRERVPAVAAALDAEAQARFAALKAWRFEVAREHNLPAFVVFNDATLAQMAREAPASLDALTHISGVGAKKLEAYGREILRVLESVA